LILGPQSTYLTKEPDLTITEKPSLATFSGLESIQFRFRGTVMWIFRSRGHNNAGGQNNKKDAFFGFGMWPTALALPATLYPYGNCENKAFGGTIALATTVYAEPIIRLFAT
jgi:hypothetical protein